MNSYLSDMYTQYTLTELCIKKLAKLSLLCNSVYALAVVLRSTEAKNVDAVIKYNSQLINELQEIQRTLVYFKNSQTPPPQFPRPPDGAA